MLIKETVYICRKCSVSIWYEMKVIEWSLIGVNVEVSRVVIGVIIQV